MVSKYFWPWDNPWTSCRLWVITPSVLKHIEHPQHLMPGFHKGPLLWSKWTNPGRKAAFSPRAQTTEGIPSQEDPGSEWHGTHRTCDSAWASHTPWPNSPSRDLVPTPEDAGLALTLMTLPRPALETLGQGAQPVLCFPQPLVYFILFKKNYPNSYHLESLTVGIKWTLFWTFFYA